MLGNSGAYAVKRRKKPVPKTVKRPPVKTSPSKRHRERLNVELEQLTSLLPFSEEVRGRLDKLSVLRLSVGYLKVKSSFHAALQKNTKSASATRSNNRNGQSVSLDGVTFSEGQFLLQALNGFVLVVTADGTIFYTSSTIQDFLGYHQSDVVHQSVYELVHMDDREMFKCQLHFALDPSETDSEAEDAQSSSKALRKSQRLLPHHIPPENSSFLERNFCCRLRCLLDNTSGFLALNFKGRLKYLHSQGTDRASGYVSPPQLALFAIVTPVQPPSVMEIRTKTLLFQTKHRMDFAPMGIDGRGKLVLGYTESELVTTGSGYQFIHAADMMHCADNHLRMIKTGESGFTIFRLLTKTRQWLWVQASARVVFKGGRPDFIISRQKALTNEEGEEHLRQRRQQLPFNLATGEGVLYDTCLDAFSTPGSPGSDASGTAEPTTEKPLDPASLLGALLRQDHSVYAEPQEPSPQFQIFSQIEDPDIEQSQSCLEEAFLDTHALLSVPGQIQTSQERSVKVDHMSEAMIDSLEQILEDLRDGGLEGLEVEETEVRDWENTLVRLTKEREDTSRELNHILANDVFSYVEEALRSEFGGYVQGSDQTLVLGTISSLSTEGQHAGFLNHELQWQPMKDMKSNGSAEQTQLVNILGGVGNLTELKGVSHRVAHTLKPTQCYNTHQGHTSSLWPTRSSNHQSGNQNISTQPHISPQSRLSSAQITNSMHGNHPGLESTDSDSQKTYMGPELWGPLAWQQQQQLPQSFHCHSLTHSSHTPNRVKSTDQSFHPQVQHLSSSCAYEKRQGHIPNANTVPSRQTGPLLGPAWSRAPTHVARTTTHSPPFTMSHPGMVVTGIQGIMRSSSPSSHMAVCPDVANITLVHLSGDNAGLGTTPSDYAPENGSLQSSFLCWNREAQIPLNGTVLPAQSISISQNTGP